MPINLDLQTAPGAKQQLGMLVNMCAQIALALALAYHLAFFALISPPARASAALSAGRMGASGGVIAQIRLGREHSIQRV